jgi:glycosyltransferase involved in cell wall biosynthesis
MNILIYIPHVSQASGGIRQYSIGLINILNELDNRFENIYIYCKTDDNELLKNIDNKRFHHLAGTNRVRLLGFKFVNAFKKSANFLFENLNRAPFFFLAELELQYYVNKYDIGIVHCPYQYAPNCLNTKVICTLHDVQELYFPEFFSPEERAHRALNYNKYIKQSDAVIVSYQHIKDDIVKFFYKSSSKVFILPINLKNHWILSYMKKDETVDFPFFDFLFYPANAWIHKNQELIILALELIQQKYKVAIPFVFSGDYNTPYGSKIKELVIEKKLEHIYFVGLVSEIDLYSLYRKSKGVVISTLYEAGSFPLMEAILMEKAVICSNVTSLPSTIGNEQFVFNPKNVMELADKMYNLVYNHVYNKESIDNSKIQSQKLLSFSNITNITKIYEEI